MRKFYLVLIILLLAGLPMNLPAQTGYKIARAGVGIDGIRVGKSTRSDVIRKYGRRFKTLKHGRYSFQMKYKNGMSFYFCQRDKRQQIFDIELRAPAKVKTAKGIILSKSTVAQVRKKYGKPKTGLRFRGIEFYYANYRGKNVISVIDIVEKGGMRQCK